MECTVQSWVVYSVNLCWEAVTTGLSADMRHVPKHKLYVFCLPFFTDMLCRTRLLSPSLSEMMFSSDFFVHDGSNDPVFLPFISCQSSASLEQFLPQILQNKTDCKEDGKCL